MVVQNATQAATAPAGRALTLRLLEIIALVLPLLGILLQVTNNQMRDRYDHRLPDEAQTLLGIILFGIVLSGFAGSVLAISIAIGGVPLVQAIGLTLITITFASIYLGGLVYFAFIVAENQQKTLSADAPYLETDTDDAESGDSASSDEESTASTGDPDETD